MELRAEDLRIGNYVNYGSLNLRIAEIIHPSPTKDRFNDKWLVGLYCNGFITSILSNIKPIPLTEEWLLKFGFEDDFINGFRKGNLVIDSQGRLHIIDDSKYGIIISRDIKYVHQIQNIFYDLRKQELQVL